MVFFIIFEFLLVSFIDFKSLIDLLSEVGVFLVDICCCLFCNGIM